MDNTLAETSTKIRIEIERARNHHDAHQRPENAHAQTFEAAREIIVRSIQKLGILDRFSEWLKANISHGLVPIRPQQMPRPISTVANVVRNP